MKNYMALYGRNSVLERLSAKPKSVKRVFLKEGLSLPRIEKLAEESNIILERVSPEKLDSMRPAKDLQGVLAWINRFEYASFDNLLDKKERPALIFLDRVNDPHNLGVIIRVAACFGGFAIVIPRFHACEVNETVIHVASGGENYTPVALVPNVSTAVLKAKGRGYWIAGAVVGDGAEDISLTGLEYPIGLVLGSEGKGIRYGIEKKLDKRLRIPMHGAKLSFNVSIAAAIFCHEITKQRKQKK